MTIKHIIFAIACTGTAAHAMAGSALDAAQAHFTAIGAADRAAILRDYVDNARLIWVGGPLDGSYDGIVSIGAVWDKFNAAAGPARVTVLNASESANPKGATVTAAVQFDAKVQVKVRYILTYRDGKLVNETWQVDPKLAAGGY